MLKQSITLTTGERILEIIQQFLFSISPVSIIILAFVIGIILTRILYGMAGRISNRILYQRKLKEEKEAKRRISKGKENSGKLPNNKREFKCMFERRGGYPKMCSECNWNGKCDIQKRYKDEEFEKKSLWMWKKR